jgi:hypothetical protein
MVLFAMGMSLTNSCFVHYGTIQWFGDEPSMLFDLFGGTFEQIYQPLTAILLRHGEVAYIVVMISRRSSNYASFPSARYPRESAITFQY